MSFEDGITRVVVIDVWCLGLCPSTSFVQRKVATAASIPSAKDQPEIAVAADDIVFVSLEKASKDVSLRVQPQLIRILNVEFQPAAFSDPLAIDPRRSPSKFYLQASGLDDKLGKWILEEIAPQMLRSIFKRKNLRRFEGTMGQLVGSTVDKQGTNVPFYLDSRGLVSSWPGSLYVVVSRHFPHSAEHSLD